MVQQIRQTYFHTHALTFHKEDTYKLKEVFKELANMAGLLGTEVYPVHDQWVGRKELHSAYHAYHAVSGSTKDLHFFRTPWVPQDNGSLRHTFSWSSKVTGGPAFFPWCGKEGQNKGTFVSHLHLLPGTNMQEVPVIFYHHVGQNVASCPRVSTHAFLQRQWRWRSRKVQLSLLNWPSGSCTLCFGQDAMPHHATLPVTPSFGVLPALDYKTSENNKNNTTEDISLAQNDYRKTQIWNV